METQGGSLQRPFGNLGKNQGKPQAQGGRPRVSTKSAAAAREIGVMGGRTLFEELSWKLFAKTISVNCV